MSRRQLDLTDEVVKAVTSGILMKGFVPTNMFTLDNKARARAHQKFAQDVNDIAEAVVAERLKRDAGER